MDYSHIYPSTPAEYEERRPRLSPRVHLSSMTSNSQHSCKKVLHAQECGLKLAGYNSTPPKRTAKDVRTPMLQSSLTAKTAAKCKMTAPTPRSSCPCQGRHAQTLERMQGVYIRAQQREQTRLSDEKHIHSRPKLPTEPRSSPKRESR